MADEEQNPRCRWSFNEILSFQFACTTKIRIVMERSTVYFKDCHQFAKIYKLPNSNFILIKISAYGLKPESRIIQTERTPYIDIERMTPTEDEYFNLDLSSQEINDLKQRMPEEDKQPMREIVLKEKNTFLLSQDCYGMQDRAMYILGA